MYKKIIAITILSIVTGLVILNSVKTKDIEVEKTQKRINNVNTLTMMIETEAGTGNYQEVRQSEWPQEGYVFNASLSRCENGGILSWDDEAKKVIMESNVSDKCYVYFDKYNPTLTNYIITNVYISDGANDLYYHDGTGSYTNANQEAGDNSYRYSGAEPNNYVCFGSDAATCPNENLYRIIGLFDDDKDGAYNIKLIKYDYANSGLLGTDGDYAGIYSTIDSYYRGNLTTINSYYWNNNTGTNAWDESELNTINLNENFWNNLGFKWQNMVETFGWKIDNMYNGIERLSSIKYVYNMEISNSSNYKIYSNKIGLMYVSDYGYAASPENWTKSPADYDDTNRNNNWMYMGLAEYTITKNYPTTNQSLYISFLGQIGSGETVNYVGIAIRPVFYLKHSVTISSGDGSKENPFRISFDINS